MKEPDHRLRQAAAFDAERGASKLLWVRRGSAIVMARGVVQIEAAPQWLADTIVRECVLLRAGAAWEAGRSGWVALTALDTARWTLHPHADASSRPTPHRSLPAA
ncbi:MAG TPA: hypothetical protein VJO99_07625 [Burkholderiaceae bacterium]|nr:hypothetical protein [Burkholderiaceae bacterium]